MKLLYKGKGNVNDVNAYRGIALEGIGLKLLIRLITERLSKSVKPLLPDEQFGFRQRRSMQMAIENLLEDTKQT